MQSTPRPQAAGFWDGFAPPKSFSKADAAEFSRLVANLRRAGTQDRTDPLLVVQAARTATMLEEAHALVAKEGLTAKGGHGSPVPHPLLAVINSMTLRLKSLYNDMGLTAASSKHGSAPKSDESQGGWGDLLTVTG
jgi:P27 family predicted phage terminase small subunit